MKQKLISFLNFFRQTAQKPWLQKTSLLVLLAFIFCSFLLRPPSPKTLSTASTKPTNRDFYLVIPKLAVEAPIIADVNGADKKTYFKALENGVAQLKGSAKPGEGSNVFIYGHSSFYKDQPGNYKQVFRNLEELEKGDEVTVWYENREFKYRVDSKKVVAPSNVAVARPSKSEQLTLMTCVPPGTTRQRLIIIAKPL